MSTDQPSLVDAVDHKIGTVERLRRVRREALRDVGAVYSKPRGESVTPQTSSGVCRRCGNDNIESRVLLVMGDNDNNVPCCAECRVAPNGREYHEDTRAIKGFHAGVGSWMGGVNE